MGIVTMIKAIKKIHEKDIVFVRKDIFVPTYVKVFKLKYNIKNIK